MVISRLLIKAQRSGGMKRKNRNEGSANKEKRWKSLERGGKGSRCAVISYQVWWFKAGSKVQKRNLKSLFSVPENKMHQGAGETRGLDKTGLEPKMQDFIVHRKKPQFTEKHEK